METKTRPSPGDIAKMRSRVEESAKAEKRTSRTSNFRRNREYSFRNLPASESPLSWAVCGDYRGENTHPLDVLEWCRTEPDANEMLRNMKSCKEFSQLYVYRAA